MLKYQARGWLGVKRKHECYFISVDTQYIMFIKLLLKRQPDNVDCTVTGKTVSVNQEVGPKCSKKTLLNRQVMKKSCMYRVTESRIEQTNKPPKNR